MVLNGDNFKNRPGTGQGQMAAQIGDWATLALILAGALAGGFVNGLTGFGTALTGLPMWLQAVEPLIAAQLASACSVLGHLTTLPTIWRAADWRRLAPMLTAGLIGVPIGTWVLPLISLATFKLGVGAVLIVYCSFMLFAAAACGLPPADAGPRPSWASRAACSAALPALSGVLPTVWRRSRAGPRTSGASSSRPSTSRCSRPCWWPAWCRGWSGSRFLVALGVAVPGTLAGSWLGVRLYRRLDDRRFDRVVLSCCCCRGWFWSGRASEMAPYLRSLCAQDRDDCGLGSLRTHAEDFQTMG